MEARYKHGYYCPVCGTTIVQMGEAEWCCEPACSWRPSMREYKKLAVADELSPLAFSGDSHEGYGGDPQESR